MSGAKNCALVLLAALCVALLPAKAVAQTGIAGVVKDSSGAVLPGVSVEASSPVLIEKARTVVTDDRGQYKIVDLRPGTYTVTFSLSGFNSLKRDDIVLTTNFTAAVNAELRVGSLEETVTVSGQSPVVDVQNVVQHTLVSKEVIEAVPTGRSMQTFAALIPGMVLGAVSRPSAQDVGGSAAGTPNNAAIHGGRTADMQELIDGVPQNSVNAINTGGITTDLGATQEFSFELGAISAESATGGVRINMVPRDGANHFSGNFFGTYTNHKLQSDNTSDELLARGLGAINQLDKNWDVNPTVGGPIKQDKLWFYFSFRYWGSNDQVAGGYYNKNPTAFTYTPDLSKRSIDDTHRTSESLRMTWQATSKDKISAFALNQGRCTCHNGVSALVSPEAAAYQIAPVDLYLQAKWTRTFTNRLLMEAAATRYSFSSPRVAEPGVTPDILSVTERSTGLVFRSNPFYNGHDDYTFNDNVSLTYVTGSHAFKVGETWLHGSRRSYRSVNGDVNLRFLNGVPQSLVQWATPVDTWDDLNAALGLFAQDQWTMKRMTINAGIRFDYHNSSVPPQDVPAKRFVAAKSYDKVSNVPNWKDIDPRLGVSYDLFGNAKTAIKGTVSRYVQAETLAIAGANNPANATVLSVTRNWTDPSGTFNPFVDCDLNNPNQNGSCGPISDAAFGTTKVTTVYDPSVVTGWSARPYQWEVTASIQQELFANVSVNAGYFWRSYGNFTVTNNQAVTPTDYDPYCITVPADSRLPGGGGNQLCGLYDVKPALFGKVSNLVTQASNFGNYWEHYNGFDITTNVRLPRSARLQGGLNMGRSEVSRCFVVDSPQELQYCDVKPPFQAQLKFLGALPLPWNLQAAAAFQTLPGPQITAPAVIPNSQIQPSLGRPLSGGANSTATVNLVSPGTMYDTRLYQLDTRLSKIFKFGGRSIQTNIDLYNMLNASPVLVVNSNYGPAWLQPTYVLPGRLFKFGAQVTF